MDPRQVTILAALALGLTAMVAVGQPYSQVNASDLAGLYGSSANFCAKDNKTCPNTDADCTLVGSTCEQCRMHIVSWISCEPITDPKYSCDQVFDNNNPAHCARKFTGAPIGGMCGGACVNQTATKCGKQIPNSVGPPADPCPP